MLKLVLKVAILIKAPALPKPHLTNPQNKTPTISCAHPNTHTAEN